MQKYHAIPIIDGTFEAGEPVALVASLEEAESAIRAAGYVIAADSVITDMYDTGDTPGDYRAIGVLVDFEIEEKQ